MSASESDSYRTSESDSIDNYSSVSDTETESDISCDPSMPGPYSLSHVLVIPVVLQLQDPVAAVMMTKIQVD